MFAFALLVSCYLNRHELGLVDEHNTDDYVWATSIVKESAKKDDDDLAFIPNDLDFTSPTQSPNFTYNPLSFTKSGETYDEYDRRRNSISGVLGELHGYGCTVDCGGHNAGYDWASDNGVTSAEECGGTSWSFKEGCMAFVEENGG